MREMIMNNNILSIKDVQYFVKGSLNRSPLRKVELIYDNPDKSLKIITEDFEDEKCVSRRENIIKFDRNITRFLYTILISNGHYNGTVPHGEYNDDFKAVVKGFFKRLMRFIWERSDKKVEVTEDMKFICIGDFNTGLKVQYMGELYSIYYEDINGNRIPVFFFKEENASEFIDKYIRLNY